ncbi:MAG: TonB-dependent receptor plug domain-containing protein, partial [Gemmatimonadetes bacterium]|nr:TonB-dependent receptor plug domain-containing protein [Gemmatimonadota bacterium]
MNRSKWFRIALTAAGAWALMAFAAPAAAQQTGTISGSVTEAGSGRPLRGVQLFIPRGRCPGTERSCPRVTAVTDDAGQYTMANVPAGQAEIRARLVGYSSQSTTVAVVGGQTFELNFTLRASVISLDEIVVTGAGVAQSKKQLGNTITTVNPADILRTRPVMSFSETLSAREPGVVVKPSGGIAGESARIEIRGTSSLSMGNLPVIYLNGVRIDNGRSLFIAASGGGAMSRPFDNIDPETIERIEVLKGAAAATLYGSEANAGVIQIFTKKGTAGAPRFNFNLQYGLSTIDKGRIKPNTGFAADATQLTNLNNIFNANVGLYEPLETTILSDLYGTGNNYTLSGDVSGGSEDFQYFVSGRWTREDGPILDELGPGGRDVNRRLQGTASFTMFPRDRVSFRLSTMFTDQHQDSPPNNNNIYGFISSATMGKPERANCNNSDFVAQYGRCKAAGNPTGQRAFATTRETAQRFIEGNLEHFNASMTGTYQAAQTLNVDVTFGIDVTNQNNFDFRPFA